MYTHKRMGPNHESMPDFPSALKTSLFYSRFGEGIYEIIQVHNYTADKIF